MSEDPIKSQIEELGYRRLAVLVGTFALCVVAAGVVLGLVIKHGGDRPTSASVALVLAGLLLGYATSILTLSSRRVARNVLLAMGLSLSLVGFAMRTLFGWSYEMPLLLVVSPLFLPAGYIAGQIKAPRR